MKYDIVIIGGGPAGLSFAKTLSESNFSVLLVERAPESALQTPSVDGRDIALTHYSMDLLEKMGVLSRIPEDAIAKIHNAKVINGDSDYCLDISSYDESVSNLGFLVPNHLIRQALYEAVTETGAIDILYETSVNNVETFDSCSKVSLSNGDEIETSLVVAADSRFSESRRQQGISSKMLDFGRVVIVSRMKHEKPHDETAFECFLYGKTLAILPLNNNISSAVVTVSADKAEDILQMSPADFSAQVGEWFEHRLGDMQLVGERYHYPLVAVHANQFVKHRYALLGDAAVGMHPVTAHGFNMGLRGQDTLFKVISSARRRNLDIGSLSVLRDYESKHMRLTKPLYYGTNEIVELFTNESIPAKVARNALLRVSNNFPPIKQLIAHKLTEKENRGNSPFPTFLG